MHISFCLCVSKAVELHLLDQKVCVFINLIDVARFPVYIHTFTISECWVLVSLHPVQVQYAIVLRVRLTVLVFIFLWIVCSYSISTFLLSCLFLFIYRASLYVKETNFLWFSLRHFSWFAILFCLLRFFFPCG